MWEQISNIHIAILGRINELAARYDLKASEVECFLLFDKGDNIITFPSTPRGGKREHFERMMTAIGAENGKLHAKDTADLEDILDAAIRNAPRGRAR